MKLYEDVAFEAHEQWRLSRLQPDGTYTPRWKVIKDQSFVTNLEGKNLPRYIRKGENGYEIDIANASYNQLSPDWQKENMEGAKIAAEIVESEENLTEEQIGDIIHNAWLERNSWAKDGPLGVPYADLPKEEQEKDLAFYYVALTMKNAKEDYYFSYNLENIVNHLKKARENEENVVCTINNGINLYSEFDNLNTCFLKVYGRTYSEQKAFEEEARAKAARERELKNLNAQAKLPEWKEKGEALIYPERKTEWENCISYRATEMYHGREVLHALDAMEALNQGKSFEEVGESVKNDCADSAMLYSLTMQIVSSFAKNGPAFYRANIEEISPEMERQLQSIELENSSFAEAEKSNLSRNKK